MQGRTAPSSTGLPLVAFVTALSTLFGCNNLPEENTGAAESGVSAEQPSLDLDVSGKRTTTPTPSGTSITIGVNASTVLGNISPEIYGVNFASSAALADLNVPLNRSGGNNSSRYNWQLNADNRGGDWYYESVPDSSSVPGERADTFIANAFNAKAQPMITIPMVGWVAKLGANREKLSSFSMAKYGLQQGNDAQWYSDAGNGVLLSGVRITLNDPNDANVPSDPAYQTAWMQHLTSRWGAASAGGLRYYILDNEPSLWYLSHRDIHPTGATMDEIRDKLIAYSNAVKDTDPSAQVVGPEEWGWSALFYSGYDQQQINEGTGVTTDRVAHGGWDYLPWLLDQLRQQSQLSGRRLLDVFTLHYYPQGGETGTDTSSSMQLLRNRSTRSMWDPNYVEESWIQDKVQLIPRLRQMVNTYYPGTRIGITEYNWGAEGHINGATAQADLLGIFGREGLDLASRWEAPATGTPTYNAFKMYRNYDGLRSTFGDVSLSTTVANPDQVSAFTARRSSDGALTVMVIAKVPSTSYQATINLAGFTPGGAAQVWQLTSTNTISRKTDIAVSSTGFTATLPAQSITLFVIPRAP